MNIKQIDSQIAKLNDSKKKLDAKKQETIKEFDLKIADIQKKISLLDKSKAKMLKALEDIKKEEAEAEKLLK